MTGDHSVRVLLQSRLYFTGFDDEGVHLSGMCDWQTEGSWLKFGNF